LPRNDLAAFTLAEVLITLGIIGVVAALTLPNLIQKNQEKVLVTQFIKTYSLLNQVYIQTIQENDQPSTWSVACNNDIVGYFTPYLKVATLYTPAGGNGNAVSLGYKNSAVLSLDKSKNGDFYPQLKVSEGQIFSFFHPASAASGLSCKFNTDMCFVILTDINGTRLPNRYGVDVFLFNARPNSIVPWVDSSQCNPGAATSSWGSLANGYACGNWILKNRNMDYLKCVDEGQSAYCHTY
jgi:type II secretory pathway pseudopilin PulG